MKFPMSLASCFLLVGTLDLMRDENVAYAARLMQAGIPTELHVYPGAPHGVALWAETDVARRYLRDQRDWLTRQLTRLND